MAWCLLTIDLNYMLKISFLTNPTPQMSIKLNKDLVKAILDANRHLNSKKKKNNKITFTYSYISASSSDTVITVAKTDQTHQSLLFTVTKQTNT